MAGVKEERKAKITIDQNGFELNRRYKIRSYFQLKKSQSLLGIQGNMVDRKKKFLLFVKKNLLPSQRWGNCGMRGGWGR